MDWTIWIYLSANMGVFEEAPNIKNIGYLNNSAVDSQTHLVTHKSDAAFSTLNKASYLHTFIKHMHYRVVIRHCKCLNHHNQRLCKIFLAGVNLLIQTYSVFFVNSFFGRIFTLFFCKSLWKWREKSSFWYLIVHL